MASIFRGRNWYEQIANQRTAMVAGVVIGACALAVLSPTAFFIAVVITVGLALLSLLISSRASSPAHDMTNLFR